MDLQILGTAACEGWPAMFCQCPACEKARHLGGKDIRTRSSLQVGAECKIDFPPDSLYHVHRERLQLAKLRHLFFTHSHEDHMDVEDLIMMMSPFGHNNFPNDPLNLYMSASAAKHFYSMLPANYSLPIDIHIVQPFEPVQAGDLIVTPVLADHDPAEQCLFYVLEQGGKTAMYACDTDIFPEETWEFLLTKKFDFVISECTNCVLEADYHGHMGLPDVIKVKERLLSAGAITNETPWWITHFSHNGNVTHEEFSKQAAPHGIQVAYDGVKFTV